MKKNGISIGDVRWKRIALGSGISFLVTLTLVAVFAGLMDREMMGLEWMGYSAVAILILSGFTGTAAVMAGGSLLETGLAACLYWVLLLGVNAVLYECVLSGMWVTLLAIAGGWGSAVLLLGLRNRRPRSRRRKYKIR